MNPSTWQVLTGIDGATLLLPGIATVIIVDLWSIVLSRTVHRGISATLCSEARYSGRGVAGGTSFGMGARYYQPQKLQEYFHHQGSPQHGVTGKALPRSLRAHKRVVLPKKDFRNRCRTAVRWGCRSFRNCRSSDNMGSRECISGSGHGSSIAWDYRDYRGRTSSESTASSSIERC